jgi:hypothetical protein
MSGNADPVKASDEQIDRWAIHLRGVLTEKHRQTSENLERRHALEREKSADEKLLQRQFNEQAELDKRKSRDLEELENKIARTKETRIIPDGSLAPLHSREEIDQWAKARRDELIKDPHNVDPPPKTIEQEQELLLNLEEEVEELEHDIAEAYRTGRIPGIDPPAQEHGPSLER